jgi:hypothetical protein
MENNYNPSMYLNLDIYKGIELFNTLEKYNTILENITYKANYSEDCNYDISKGGASFWFDARQVRKTPLPSNYPHILPIQLDTQFNLVLHIANYMSLLIIYMLYKQDKGILIEDMCCGMGNLVFYLSKLGFDNFSMIDNFSQLPKTMFDDTMLAIKESDTNFKFQLNNFELKPKVFNLVAYTQYVKRDSNNVEIIPDSIDLFMSYVPLVPESRHLNMDNTKFFEKYVCLAKDPNRLLWSYCKKEKYEEFKSKLEMVLL